LAAQGRRDARGPTLKIISCKLGNSGYLGNMDWQQLVSLAIVAAAAGLFGWSRLRARRFSFQRDTHCGCSGAHPPAVQSSIVFRARKGHRPEVQVRMK
jgi:hypothetical protein